MPTYRQNKEHIYNWRGKNRANYNTIRVRYYYKCKAKEFSPAWADIKYIFLDILIDDYQQ